MKHIGIVWSYETDGDFYLDVERLNRNGIQNIDIGFESYMGCADFEGTNDAAVERAVDYLSKIVSATCEDVRGKFVVQNVANMMANAIVFLRNPGSRHIFSDRIGGNYDGTNVNVYVMEV